MLMSTVATYLLILSCQWLAVTHSSLHDTGQGSHVEIKVDGIKVFVDPCSLETRPGGTASETLSLQSCFRFGTSSQNGSSTFWSGTCRLRRLPRGTIAVHDSPMFPDCNPSRGPLSAFMLSAETTVTAGPLYDPNGLLACALELYRQNDYSCEPCTVGKYAHRDAGAQLEPRVQTLHRCQPCTNKTDCIKGHTWAECSSKEDGACMPCTEALPEYATWDVGCAFVCTNGFFRHGARCHRCIYASGDANVNARNQACNAGYFKKCSDGLILCVECSNYKPAHAEYSAPSTHGYSDEYSDRCPWRCSLGFSYNEDQTACEPCSSSKPNHAHWVLDEFQGQVFMNGRCPFQCDLGYQPLHGQCLDDIGWTDMYDANCSMYEESPKWCVNADKYSNANKGSAKDACCVCGGGNRLIDCIPCTNLPDGAVWTTQDIEPKNDSFSRVWKVSANCDWVCKQMFQGHIPYTAGTQCNRCDIQPCEKGFFRDRCRHGEGSVCVPCTNALPGGAKFSASGEPIHANNCEWVCKDPFDRHGDICVVGRVAVLMISISAGLLLAVCALAISFNMIKSLTQRQNRSQQTEVHAEDPVTYRADRAPGQERRFWRLTEHHASTLAFDSSQPETTGEDDIGAEDVSPVDVESHISATLVVTTQRAPTLAFDSPQPETAEENDFGADDVWPVDVQS